MVSSRTPIQQNPPVINWGCCLAQIVLHNGCKRYGSSSKKCRENDIAFHFSGARKLPRRPTAVDCRSHVYLHGQLRRSSRLHNDNDDDDDDDKLKSRRAPTTTVAVA